MYTDNDLNVHEWSEGSRPAFDEAKRRWGDPVAYEQSWVYVCQALRRGGWICRSSAGWMAIARNYRGRGRHVGVVPLATDLVVFVQTVARVLESSPMRPETIKHIPQELAHAVATAVGGSPRRRDEVIECTWLDDVSEDRFPQVLFDVSEGGWLKEDTACVRWLDVVPAGHDMASFRYQIRRFCRTHLEKGVPVRVRPVSIGSIVNDCTRVLQGWVGSFRHRLGRRGVSIRDVQGCLFDPVQAVAAWTVRHRAEAIGQAIDVNGVPSAVWLGSAVSRQTLGLYVFLASTDVRHLSDYVLYLALSKARELGFKWTNLGGSELSELYRFKARGGKLSVGSRIRCRDVAEIDLPVAGSESRRRPAAARG